MLRSRVPRKFVRRGAATVEFALVVPLLVSITMFSMFLCEIVRAKIKLQEASRYAAWEMSSYTLSDYGGGDHDKAFDVAMKSTVKEAAERYKDLDSLEPEGKFGFMLKADPVQVKVENQTVAGVDLSRIVEGGGAGGEAAGLVGKGLNAVLGMFDMNTKGQVQVDLTSKLSSVGLPRNYLEKPQRGFFDVDQWGGRDLSNLAVKNRFTLIANGWHLPDGGNAIAAGKQSGVHSGGSRQGMAMQVGRMKFLGITNFLDSAGLGGLGSVANFIFPDFFGTYVVANNYEPSNDGHDCNKTLHGAMKGLNNVNAYPGLDDDKQRCFDTAPYRDTQKYDDSLYRKVFQARGKSFMGCKNEQADMPNTPNLDPSVQQDKNADKISCE